jgi:uncharacterized membrane protein
VTEGEHSKAPVRVPRMVTVLVIVATVALTVAVYPELPSEMATHWNASGEADGFSSKGFGTFLMPLIMAGIVLLMWAVPLLDPLRKNIEVFRVEYEWFIVAMTVFFAVMQAQILLWNLGYEVSPNAVLPVSISLLFFYIGWMLRRARRNFFIGIRTPWTLMSSEVWDKTHKLGGALFMIAGAITLLGAVFPDYSVWFVLVPILTVTGITIAYSYVLYQRVGPDEGDDAVIPPAP